MLAGSPRSTLRTLGRAGTVLAVLAALVVPATSATATSSAGSASVTAPPAPYPYAQTFMLHSDPGSSRIIYLDFVGYSDANGTDAPYDTDGDPTTFSDAEQDVIQNVWARVSENFAAFDVDVTTEDPGSAALVASPGSTSSGVAVVITSSASGIAGELGGTCTAPCVGSGYTGWWGRLDPTAIVFSSRLSGGTDPQGIAEVATHEVGHTLDLLHDITSRASSLWSAIMSANYQAAPIMQWTSTPGTQSSTGADELAIIEETLTPKVDGYGQSSAQATALPGTSFDVAGTITASTQADWFSFTVPSGYGPLNLDVAPSPYTSMLDLDATLFDSSLNVVQDSNPPATYVSSAVATGLDAPFSDVSLAPGTYYLRVEGSGGTGYSSYGSIGSYTITGSLAPPVPCAAGSYSDTGDAPCTATPAGSYDAGTGNTSPVPCPSGTSSPAGSAGCTATTMTLAYTGEIHVAAGATLPVSASLASSAPGCQSGQPVTYSLSTDPLNGQAGTYVLGTATSSASGAVPAMAVGTAGWQAGAYVLTASYAGATQGATTCPAATGTTALVVTVLRLRADGAGQYAVAGLGPTAFSFVALPAASTGNVGTLDVVTPGAWLFQATVGGFHRVNATKGVLSGSGVLQWWNPALNSGSGGWQLAASGVTYTATALASTKGQPGSFGIQLSYTPVAPQPSVLPNSSPTVLYRGAVVIY